MMMGMTADRDRDFRNALERTIHTYDCSLPTEGNDACPICSPLWDQLARDNESHGRPYEGLSDMIMRLNRETLERWPDVQ